ncbi:hypothetical protein [Bacillus sp. mrc49]|nr:hypothetical protein [Bacillus sp. mrc49]
MSIKMKEALDLEGDMLPFLFKQFTAFYHALLNLFNLLFGEITLGVSWLE